MHNGETFNETINELNETEASGKKINGNKKYDELVGDIDHFGETFDETKTKTNGNGNKANMGNSKSCYGK